MAPEVPATHKAAVVVRDDAGGFHFTTQTRPVPSIQPWEILVKLSASGVCGTDLFLAKGLAGPSCDILGHEGVGRVVALGSGVDPATAPRVGARVGIAWVRDVCGACAACRAPGGETRCVEQLNSGRKWDGTFAEYAVVPARYVLELPDTTTTTTRRSSDPGAGGEDLPDEMVAPILCGGVTAYKALKVCGATPGQWVAILGAGGGVGALVVQYARAMGYLVVAIDIGPAKREFALSQGTHVFVDAVAEDVVAAVQTASRGEGVAAAIVCAGSAKAYDSAAQVLAMFGTLVVVGISPPDQKISLHPLEFIDRGIKVEGVAVGTRTDTLEALEFVRRGAVKPVVMPIALEDLDRIAGSVATSTGKYVIRF